MKTLRFNRTKWAAWLAAIMIMLLPSGVMACATCMGAPGDPLTKGLNAGILSLLVMVLLVLTGAAAFFIYLARRASATPQPEETNP